MSATKWRTQRSAARETPGTFTLPHPISFHDAKHLCLHEITASVTATALVFRHATDGCFELCNAVRATRCATWAIGHSALSEKSYLVLVTEPVARRAAQYF